MANYLVVVGKANLLVLANNLAEVESKLRVAVSCSTALNNIAQYLVNHSGFTVVADEGGYQFQNTVRLSYKPTAWAWYVEVLNSSGNSVYNGSLIGFATRVPSTNWNDYVGKVVKFNYDGGTDYGGERLVKVSRYDGAYLVCVDLEKEKPRNYSVSKVSKIKVVA